MECFVIRVYCGVYCGVLGHKRPGEGWRACVVYYGPWSCVFFVERTLIVKFHQEFP